MSGIIKAAGSKKTKQQNEHWTTVGTEYFMQKQCQKQETGKRTMKKLVLKRTAALLAAFLVMAFGMSGGVTVAYASPCAAGRTVFLKINSNEISGYKTLSEEEAVKTYNNYIATMTPGCAPLQFACNGDIPESLKYKEYKVYFDRYMKFAYQAAQEWMQEIRGQVVTKTYYEYSCEVREVHSEMTASEYQEAIAKARKFAADNNYGSDYEKMKRTYQWVSDTVSYDYSYKDGSIYDALIKGSSVCVGYAGAFQVVMEAMGLECYINEGKVESSGKWEDHAWNIVKLDGRYYFVDVTWGDTSGDLDKYFLFGTNLRQNTTPLSLEASYYQPGSSVKPTEAPTLKPTEAPTPKPTEAPTPKPTKAPEATQSPAVSTGQNGGDTGSTKPENTSFDDWATNSDSQGSGTPAATQSGAAGNNGNQTTQGQEDDTRQTVPSSGNNNEDDGKNTPEEEKQAEGGGLSALKMTLVAGGVVLVGGGALFSYIWFFTRKGR